MVTPEGAPVIEKPIGVVPVAVTWNVLLVPNTEAALFALVIAGAVSAALTVTVATVLVVAAVCDPFTAVLVFVTTT